MDEKALSVVLDNIRNLAAINRKTGSHLSLGTGFLTGKETVRLKNCLKSAVWILAQFRPFQEDMTDISVEYERLRQKYEDKSFRVLASIQKCEAFQGGMAKPYDHCRGLFFPPSSPPMLGYTPVFIIARIPAALLAT